MWQLHKIFGDLLIQLIQILVAIGDEQPDDFGLVEFIIRWDALRDQHDEIDLDDIDLIHILCLCDLNDLSLPLIRLIPHHESHSLPHHCGEVALVDLNQEHILYLFVVADFLHQ